MKGPRIRRRFDQAPEPDGVVPWGGREGSFGWFLHVAPWWWPRGPDGPRAPGLLQALAGVNAQIQLRTGRLSRTSTASHDRWQDLPNLVPAQALPQGTPDFDEVSSPAGLCGRGLEVYLRINHCGAGGLPEPQCSYVEEILIGDLRTRGFEGDVVQAWWGGDGNSDLPEATPIRIRQPKRELIPFLSASAAFTYFTSLAGWTPSLVYPDDGAWALATDISLVSSYLGCSRELAKQFHDSPNLEVLEVSPDDPLS